MSSYLTNPYISDDNSVDVDDKVDPTDMIDADAFEIFNSKQQANCSANIVPDSEESILLEDNPAPPTIQTEADSSESNPLVVIDQFPFGQVGVTTSDAYQCTINDTSYNALEDSI